MVMSAPPLPPNPSPTDVHSAVRSSHNDHPTASLAVWASYARPRDYATRRETKLRQLDEIRQTLHPYDGPPSGRYVRSLLFGDLMLSRHGLAGRTIAFTSDDSAPAERFQVLYVCRSHSHFAFARTICSSRFLFRKKNGWPQPWPAATLWKLLLLAFRPPSIFSLNKRPVAHTIGKRGRVS